MVASQLPSVWYPDHPKHESFHSARSSPVVFAILNPRSTDSLPLLLDVFHPSTRYRAKIFYPWRGRFDFQCAKSIILVFMPIMVIWKLERAQYFEALLNFCSRETTFSGSTERYEYNIREYWKIPPRGSLYENFGYPIFFFLKDWAEVAAWRNAVIELHWI